MSMIRKFAPALVLAVVVAGCGGDSIKLPSFTAVNLGRPVTGFTVAGAASNGDFYGRESASGLPFEALIYRANGTVTPIVGPYGSDINLLGMSSNGNWVGVEDGSANPLQGNGATGTDFILGLAPRGGDVFPQAINNAGAVAGVYVDENTRVFIKPVSGATTLYTNVTGYIPRRVIGITTAGVAVGIATPTASKGSYYFLTSGSTLIVGDPGEIVDVEDDGRIVGNDSIGPFRMNSPVGVRIRLPLPNATTGYVYGLNNKGDMVGEFSVGGVTKPCLWDSNTGAFLDLSGNFPADGNYRSARSITNSGDILVVREGGSSQLLRLNRL
jgi:hypothetical protein